jgi:hypothetical protein
MECSLGGTGIRQRSISAAVGPEKQGVMLQSNRMKHDLCPLFLNLVALIESFLSWVLFFPLGPLGPLYRCFLHFFYKINKIGYSSDFPCCFRSKKIREIKSVRKLEC